MGNLAPFCARFLNYRNDSRYFSYTKGPSNLGTDFAVQRISTSALKPGDLPVPVSHEE